MKYVTKCCKFVFFGKNHSPEHNGVCRHCGRAYLGEDVRKLSAHIKTWAT